MIEAANVLFVDDEPHILRALERLFVDDDIRVLTSASGVEALKTLASDSISVIVSDNRMPGMVGIEFLSKAKVLSPDSIRIMLTGHVDVESAMNAINEGEVYKFIAKPWDDGEMRGVVLDSINRYNMAQSLQKADEYSMLSLAQTIELKDPYTKGHCGRVARYAVATAEALGLEEHLREHIRRGGWLHDCGKIGVPESILTLNGPLNPDQMAIVKKHPSWGAEVARLAHLPEPVINVILYHHERYDGTGYPLGLKGNEIPVEARVVNVADIYDALTSERPYRSPHSHEQAAEVVRGNRGSYSDPVVVDAFIELVEGGNQWNR